MIGFFCYVTTVSNIESRKASRRLRDAFLWEKWLLRVMKEAEANR